MSTPKWVNGEPSYSAAVTPSEALQELRDAVSIARDHVDDSKRVRLSLALMWAEWKISGEAPTT